ncbi:hypothetical protein GBO66_08950 [Pediococcus acidilactici]|uniref:hypothetical protein n=1 Tax=Pediococcus acidilactici TaxID=1254 RepID=UPI001330CA67|nr:hypothetical protein [Pediococcus acidilactici]KAF0388214.1 hypothetical protein GBO66_08950 [Pediococcus acidilactici]KAF0802268.1 hypothetical protein GBP45_06120 [Pediococcus acidilactici]
MINGKITNFDDLTKKEEWDKIPQLLARWTLNRKDNAFTESIKVGDAFSVDEEIWVIVQILEIGTHYDFSKKANFIINAKAIAQNAGIYDYQTEINKFDFGQPSEVKTVKNADGISGYEPNRKVGDFVNLNRVTYRTLGRVSNILCYELSFGSFKYKFDIEEIQPLPFDEIRKAVKKERLKNVEITADSGNVTKINFKKQED